MSIFKPLSQLADVNTFLKEMDKQTPDDTQQDIENNNNKDDNKTIEPSLENLNIQNTNNNDGKDNEAGVLTERPLYRIKIREDNSRLIDIYMFGSWFAMNQNFLGKTVLLLDTAREVDEINFHVNDHIWSSSIYDFMELHNALIECKANVNTFTGGLNGIYALDLFLTGKNFYAAPFTTTTLQDISSCAYGSQIDTSDFVKHDDSLRDMIYGFLTGIGFLNEEEVNMLRYQNKILFIDEVDFASRLQAIVEKRQSQKEQ